MNQEIGINFTVRGQDKIIQAVEQIETRLEGLGSKVETFAKGMQRAAGAFQEGGGFMREFRTELGSATGVIRSASTALGGLNSNIDAVNRHNVNPNIFDPVTRSAEAANKAVASLGANVQKAATAAGPGGGTGGGLFGTGGLGWLIPGFWLRLRSSDPSLHRRQGDP